MIGTVAVRPVVEQEMAVAAGWFFPQASPEGIAAHDGERRIILPLVRIADLGREGGQLLTGGNPGLGVHPRQIGEAGIHRSDDVLHQRIGLGLRGLDLCGAGAFGQADEDVREPVFARRGRSGAGAGTGGDAEGEVDLLIGDGDARVDDLLAQPRGHQFAADFLAVAREAEAVALDAPAQLVDADAVALRDGGNRGVQRRCADASIGHAARDVVIRIGYGLRASYRSATNIEELLTQCRHARVGIARDGLNVAHRLVEIHDRADAVLNKRRDRIDAKLGYCRPGTNQCAANASQSLLEATRIRANCRVQPCDLGTHIAPINLLRCWRR